MAAEFDFVIYFEKCSIENIDVVVDVDVLACLLIGCLLPGRRSPMVEGFTGVLITHSRAAPMVLVDRVESRVGEDR